ncbi:MAG: DUF1365 domain-containing protein, partial [Pseudomonadales bacterium]
MNVMDHIQAHTYHGRKGAVENAFRYSIDYVLLDPKSKLRSAKLFSRNRFNLFGIYDKDHGGAVKAGRGTAWVENILQAGSLPGTSKILLLAQPRILGHVFNPVSFWLCYDDRQDLRVVIAEVSNTFGQRHSYLCHRDDLGVITAQDKISAEKIFHVSPFQPVIGSYKFCFDICPNKIEITIDYTNKQFKSGKIVIDEGDTITIDGTSGEVMLGTVPTVQPKISGYFSTIMSWSNKFKKLKIRT